LLSSGGLFVYTYIYHTVEMSGEYSSSRDTKKASYGNRAEKSTNCTRNTQ